MGKDFCIANLKKFGTNMLQKIKELQEQLYQIKTDKMSALYHKYVATNVFFFLLSAKFLLFLAEPLICETFYSTIMHPELPHT